MKLPILSLESRLVQFLELLFELIILNLLTLLFSVPIVTAGTAVTALYRSLFNIRKGKADIVKGYFKAFIDNLRSGMVLGLIFLLISISFVLYLFEFQNLIADGNILAFVGIAVIAVIFFFPMTFTFPLLAMFDNSALRTLTNAFLLSLRHVGTSIIVLLISGSPWLVLMIWPTLFVMLIPLFLIFGVSLPAWISSSLLLQVFKKYSEL